METGVTHNVLPILALLLVTFSGGTGLTLAIAVFYKKQTSPISVFMHGLLSGTGVVLIVVYFIRHAGNFPTWIISLFIVTALLGFFLFWKDIRHKSVGPLAVVLLHILFAFLSILSLVEWCFF
jgi:hypothetical protein